VSILDTTGKLNLADMSGSEREDDPDNSSFLQIPGMKTSESYEIDSQEARIDAMLEEAENEKKDRTNI